MAKRKIADYLRRPKEVIRKQRVQQRQKFSRSSLLGAIRGFLTADSFMYGPLVSKTSRTPGIRLISETDREEGATSSSPVRILKDFLSPPKDDRKDSEEPFQQVIDQLEEASEASEQVVQGTYVSVQKTVTTTTTVGGSGPGGQIGILHHHTPATPKSADAGGDTELTEPLGDADEEHSWNHEREDDFHDHIPLDEALAEQVANRLIGGLGGRFSDDLGINVDISNDEVERWFLAANFFCRSVPFDVSKKTYKELLEAGVSKTPDLLTLEEGTLAAILEKTGFTKYGQRVASQLQKLATRLESNNWGRVSTFKHTSDYQELIRQLRSLPGVKLFATRIFLRELRGVWIGAPHEFDMKTKRAAIHLKLLGSIKASSEPETVLSEFSQSAGIDLRDLEVALFKLASEHDQHYGECPGGSECKVLRPSENLVATLPSDILL